MDLDFRGWTDERVRDYYLTLNNDRPRGRRGSEVAYHRAWRKEVLKKVRQEMKRRGLDTPRCGQVGANGLGGGQSG